MGSYKEWGYQLFPGLAFEDLASRTEKLGGRARVRDLLTELRDQERDRVLEEKFGRSAVDSAHAQEAAKAATEEAVPEEGRDSEDPANSRYMDVDEEEGETGISSGSGVNGGDEKRAKVAADVMSEQVRQRMEMNRRLALERLRLKKEEAAVVAKAKTSEGTDAGMSVEESELVDLMDAGGGDDAVEDDFEEDELALAEMVDEEIAKPTVANASVGAPIAPRPAADTTTVAPICPAAAPPASLDANPAADGAAPIANSAEATPALEDVDTDSILASTARTEKANTTDTVADEPAPVPDVPDQNDPTDGATSIAASKDAESHAIASETANSSASPGIPNSEPNTGSVESPGDSTAREEGAGGAGEMAAGKQGDSALAPRVSGAGLDAATDDADNGTMVVDGQASFSSPGRCKAAVGEAALSPLGNMFAGTDVPLEGGTAAVKTSRGGLFDDEKM